MQSMSASELRAICVTKEKAPGGAFYGYPAVLLRWCAIDASDIYPRYPKPSLIPKDFDPSWDGDQGKSLKN
jgi:hypothetical protein